MKKLGTIHRESNGDIYRMMRKGQVKLVTATDENINKFFIGAVEKQTKNGWIKLRTRGLLNADKIILAFPK